ncbi:MAG TPA: carbon monoxide dehydrogenase subunit G [Thermoanaerobaculia bacterium]|nr:carbon monoxide dehydrogenase subunit G [Thermoanaerobaculia bacterium]
MKLTGEYRYEVTRERLWEALLDPEILAGTLPGCEELQQTGENAYRGKLEMKVGPVQGLFEGTVVLTNLDPPNGYDLDIDGKGAPGFMKGTGSLRLVPDGDGTILHYEIDAQVGGRIASVGQRLVESSAKVITRQGLQGLERQLGGGATATAADAAPAPAASGGEPELAPVGQADRAQAQRPEARSTASGAPSQAAFAGDFVKGLAGELVPKQHRPALFVALALITVIVIAVVMRTCGG